MALKVRFVNFKMRCSFIRHETNINVDFPNKSYKRGFSTKYSIDQSESTFKKVLIANRGEIACRIIQTAKRMGIKTVAVYSVDDSQAKHVKLADEKIFIGLSSAMDSYLNIEKILNAVRETGADALHPGYGFLSENFDLVKQLESEGVTFIGPSAEAIFRMGDKLESKRTALAAGVNVIPGFDGIVTEVDHCLDIARNLGYPVMIKASAGGGGKGMRIARNDQDVREGFLLSTQEAASSFGDTRMLVEKFIENPRHIEIQVLGDKHGNIIHLNERECSIQRRNQKVIEEAPSFFLDKETRAAMGEQSVALCKQLQYSSAGTVEFLVDQEKHFYFLEMNTRLQVEHAVTECITGVDLVHQMFRVAKGYELNISQEDVQINGWAIETRIYAEDPYNKNFGLPSCGRIYKYQEPLGVRCDSGVEEGSKVSVYYDSLICKLVCHDNNRENVIEKSIKALDTYIIRGIEHNIPLLRDVLSRKSFREGCITTNYLPLAYPEGFKGLTLEERDRHKLVAVAAVLFAANELKSRDFINIPESGIRGKAPREKWHLFIRFDEEKLDVEVALEDNGQFRIELVENVFSIEKNEIKLSEAIMELTVNGERNIFQLLSRNSNGEFMIIYKANKYILNVLPKKVSNYLKLMPKKMQHQQQNEICAPMSGVVKSVFCSVGESVQEGQELLILESMKMQNFIIAQSSGKVQSVEVSVGNSVKYRDLLIKFE
ncbi:hypothetical protein ABEB36_002741 [Hypothenemus hampei]|uniref:Propionyl-CoA carboxylase n=1 Tax=Hypothenemus hampei TaxID=57062 RepID=A0ABD1F8M5_HYPHA